MGQAAQQGDELRLSPGVSLGKHCGELGARRGQLYAQGLRGTLEGFTAGNDPGEPRLGRSEMKALLQQSSGRGREIIQVRYSGVTYVPVGDNFTQRTLRLPSVLLPGRAITAGSSWKPLQASAAQFVWR